MSKQKKYHFIYKTTCTVTGKFYVGMHSTDNIEDGYLGSGKILGYSRNKYGDENHQIERLEFVSSRDELKQREKEIVNEELLKNPLNINLKFGGEGGSILGWVLTPSQRLSFSSLGGKACLEKHASKMGKKGGLAVAQKIRMGLMIPQFTGKQHSEETKLKISASMQGKQFAEKNSQFGTCWVTNSVKPIKIKKEFLEEYLANGYSKGRKLFPSSSVVE